LDASTIMPTFVYPHSQALTALYPALVPEMLLLLFACVLFLGGTFRPGRQQWSLVALAGLVAGLLILWVQRAGAAAPPTGDSLFVVPFLFDSLSTVTRVLALVSGILFVLVGGNPEILEWTRARMRILKLTDDVLLTGFVAPTDVTAYQSAADVLVYHMPDSMEIFPYCTPAKGFEYQAAERPIVATDIPLFDEVFGAQSGERAIRVDRTPSALAGGIVVALKLPDRSEEMTRRAAAWVSGRTWRSRTQQILAAAGF
jgi:hypothetical protein